MFGNIFTPTHLIIILVVVLLIYGPSKLGSIGQDLGKSFREFKKGLSDEEKNETKAEAKTEIPAETKTEVVVEKKVEAPAPPQAPAEDKAKSA